jgi:hypothetical protein
MFDCVLRIRGRLGEWDDSLAVLMPETCSL